MTRESKLSEKEVRSLIAEKLREFDPTLNPVVEFDYSFV